MPLAQDTRPFARTATRDVPDTVCADDVLSHLATLNAGTDAVRAAAEASLQPVRAPTGRFLAATTAWAAITFAICYIALPVVYYAFGLRPYALSHNFGSEAVAFAFAWSIALFFIYTKARATQGVHIDFEALVSSDRIPAAMVGGVLSWAVAHNTLPGLASFGEMPSLFFQVFLLANLFENALLGTVFASVATTRSNAFFVGFIFQALLTAIAVTLFL